LVVGDRSDSPRSRLLGHRRRAWFRIPLWARVVLGLLVAGTSLGLAASGAGAAAVVQIATVVSVAALLAYGPRRHDMPRRTRGLLLSALGAAFAASVMWAAYQGIMGRTPPHPWLGDAVSFLYVPFTIAALMFVPPASQRTGYRARAIADGLFAMSSLWYLVAGLGGRHYGLHLGDIASAQTEGLITSAGDVCVVATALAVLSRCEATVVLTVGGIAAGVTAIAVNDIWQLLTGRSPYGSGYVLLFQVAMLLFLAAAALPAPRKATTLHRLQQVRFAVGAAPFLPILACIGVTVVIILRGQGIPQPQVLPALLIALALMARQYVGSRDKQRLVKALRERETKLEFALRRDNLTGLGNRLALMERLSEVLADESQWPVAVALLDLNDFKLINDNHGHAVGDEILRRAADRLVDSVRGDDLVVRLGGDEFAVVATQFSESHRDPFVARLLGALEAPLEAGGGQFQVAASVGIVVAEPAQTAGALLAHADAAMYRAKEDKQATSGVTFLEDAERRRVIRHLSIREQIANPDLSQFQVHYQPIVDLATGRTRGFEALLRWMHPEFGAVRPDVFIPLAEQAGSITTLGQYVLSTAAADLARMQWRHRSDRLFVSVNVSPRQLMRQGFANEVLAELAAHGVAPDQIALEITEQAYTSNLTPVENALTELAAAGITVSIDDFGTGYSTLRYLQRLQPKVVKVDRSFISDLSTGPAAGQLISAVHTMAQTLGLRMVAEGIETPAQLEFLQSINCELGQGYLFSPARPFDDVPAMLGAVYSEARAKPSRLGS
jgi:diguanylate cyclase (GGDEF)-like protein